MRRVLPRSLYRAIAALTVVALLAATGWLALGRSGGGWRARLGLGSAAPDVVTIAPETPFPAGAAAGDASRAGSMAPPIGGGPAAPEPRRGATAARRPAPTVDRWVLETGPFGSPEAADRVEDELNRLGLPTIRFRKHDTPRVYLVTATGFASIEEARRAQGQLGRGTITDQAGTVEILLDRLPTLGEAIAAARPLRARGLDVRVTEAISPVVTYHLRYGRLGEKGQAEALRDELGRNGIRSRVVKVR